MALANRRLTHPFSPHYAALRAIRTRRELLTTPLYREIGPPLEALLAAVEHDDSLAEPPALAQPGRLRVAAWNIQRGMHFDLLLGALRDDPILRDADVVLLVEVDNGMARSHDRHVARELAAALRRRYAFAPSYLVLEDDFGENPEGRPNSTALHGAAVLSRLPLLDAENVDLPELRDKFSSSEKRLGKKRALLCTLDLGAVAPGQAPLPVAALHLDSNASPRQRAAQLAAVLERRPAGPLLCGGDFNLTTYNASSPWALARDLLHKWFTLGFRGTVNNYMTPRRRYEQPAFEILTAHGMAWEGFNDEAQGTYRYDLNSPYAIEKVREKVGGFLTRALQRALRPWGGVVPARLDWFAGRGLTPVAAGVVAPWKRGAPDESGAPASDHAAIYVDLRL